ncbi:hypothetical protein K9O30_21360 [Clostridium bowmanii]|uniref:hypothetical protein n=1 Tax=Clostridium bowmanii TaxID=132925 RepID=UPI001C0E11FC|nr:hypothetical protein [Clostridium bowmanii]MBU3191963.1 hypothetical protein [Clostridium bowmanii]MCA1076224.1 hypothetical protein [Clostridium bowmanii]
MSKNCIFNDRKICNNCGECEVCELDSNKKCNNCGKCLELEGYDVKAINIDEVFEDEVIEGLDNDFYDKNEIDLSEVKEELEEDSENEIHELQNSKELQDSKELTKAEELAQLEKYDLLLEEEEEQSKLNEDGFIPENDEVWEYIDDINGITELLENEEDNEELLHEEFPGLIRVKNM